MLRDRIGIWIGIVVRIVLGIAAGIVMWIGIWVGITSSQQTTTILHNKKQHNSKHIGHLFSKIRRRPGLPFVVLSSP